MKKRIAIFASGSGTNAANIIGYFRDDKCVEISLVVSNKADAMVLKRAEAEGVSALYLPAHVRGSSEEMLDLLNSYSVDFIVLAGYMVLVPNWLVDAYRGKIVNIHPALLPKFGGKGMYGEHVHRAVIEAGETQSGITIHHVNENYDEGDIIFQATCNVYSNDTPETLAARVHELEYTHYPEIIEKLLQVKR